MKKRQKFHCRKLTAVLDFPNNFKNKFIELLTDYQTIAYIHCIWNLQYDTGFALFTDGDLFSL